MQPIKQQIDALINNFYFNKSADEHDSCVGKLLLRLYSNNPTLPVTLAHKIIAYVNPRLRYFPPVSASDTVVGRPTALRSQHGTMQVFHPCEIQQVVARSPGTRTAMVTNDGKTVLQQQSTRGCVHACAAMLLADHNRPIDWRGLSCMNNRKIERIHTDFEKAGLEARTSYFHKNDLQELKNAIDQAGSIICTMAPERYSSHAVIVDAIDDTSTLLRDPYHGWQIRVQTNAFLQQFEGGVAVQVGKAFAD